jgi:5-methylcytosine-specific restriction endonuclease McrA
LARLDDPPYVDEAAIARAAARAAKPPRDLKRWFYASGAWRRLRYKVLAANAQRHGGVPRCQLCAARAASGSPLNVDHIVPLSKDWSRRLDPTNLQILCQDCNIGKSNRDAIDWRQAEDERPVDVGGFGIRPSQ